MMCSPDTPSTTRLVTSTRSVSTDESSSETKMAARARCSKLSSISRSFFLTEEVSQLLKACQFGSLQDAYRLRHRRRNKIRIVDLGEPYHVHAVREFVAQLVGRVQRQPSLARSTGASQAHQSRSVGEKGRADLT